MQTIQTAEAETLTEEQIAALIADAPAGTPEAFFPDTAEKCDWVLGKIADRRARAARIRENAEKMAREEERAAEHLEWRYGGALQTFLRAQIEGSKKKSIRLFNGVLGLRTRPAGICVTNEAAALSWAEENLPGAVVKRLDKKALNDALTQTGEALPFAQFQPAEETFYIK